MSSRSRLGLYSFPSISAIEQLAVQMPHSKQFFSFLASNIFSITSLVIEVELSKAVGPLKYWGFAEI
jgi:hypothetical protein